MIVGNNIRKARILRGLTQKELASALSKNKRNVSHNSVSNWETGISSPEVELLPYICGILDVDANFLLGWPSVYDNEFDEQIKKIATDNGVEISYAKDKPLEAEDVLEVNKILMEELNNNKN